ncbi:MAG: beta-galactosidase [Chloroflexota bacterium]
MSTQNNAKQQVRSFVLIWILITLMMGACTFAAIYTAYGVVVEDDTTSQQVAAADSGGQSAPVNFSEATQAFPTRPPTREVTALPTSTPQQVVQAQSQPLATATPLVVQAEPTAEPTQTPIPPTPLPVENTDFQLGIQVQSIFDADMDLWMGEVEKLGMEWVKIQARWEVIEPSRGEWDWAALDKGIEAAAERDIKVLISAVTAPDWSREPGVNLAEHGPPASNEDWTNFLSELLNRHPGKIHAVEVWNEQNLDREWTSVRGLRPADYVEMLRVSYQTIKNIDPGIVVISGALSPTGLDNRVNAWDDFNYMDAMIASGMLNYTDCVGAHHNGINVGPSFTWDAVPNDPTAAFRGPFDNPHHSWAFRSTLQGYDLRVKQAGGDQKLCVTEFGWASTEDLGVTRPGFEFASDNTLEEQRIWTIEAINNMVEWDIVQIATLWNLNYGPQAGWDPNNDNVAYSIIGKDWNFRPVYGALQEWTDEYYGN